MASVKKLLRACFAWKTFRVLFILTMFVLCFMLIQESLSYWRKHPFTSSATSVWQEEIPFPALTVCATFNTKWLAIERLLQRHDQTDDIFDMFANDTQLVMNALDNYATVSPFEDYQEILHSPLLRTTILKVLFEGHGLLPMLSHFFKHDKQLSILDQMKVEALEEVMVIEKNAYRGLQKVLSRYPQNGIPIFNNQINGSKVEALSQFLVFMAKGLTRIDRSSLITLAIDIASNPGKYGSKASGSLRVKIMDYVGGKTASLLGLPAPILYDLFYVRTPYSDIMFGDFGRASHGSFASIFSKQKKWNSFNAWSNYENHSGKDFVDLVYNCTKKDRTNCNSTEVLKQTNLNWTVIEEFNNDIILDAHEQSSYPLIPFCWFGYKLNWIGLKNLTSYGKNGIPKCDLFQRVYPLAKNCFTTKPNIRRRADGNVVPVGVENGLVIVLENFFGRDFHRSNIQGLTAFLHSDMDPPDTHFYAPGIEIAWNARNDIVFKSVQYKFTSTFLDLDKDQRNCRLDSEAKSELFSHYSMTSCVLEALLSLSLEQCGCLPMYPSKTEKIRKTFGNISVCILKDIQCYTDLWKAVRRNGSLTENCFYNCDTSFYHPKPAGDRINLLDDPTFYMEEFEESPLYNHFFLKPNQNFTNEFILLGGLELNSELDYVKWRLSNMAVLGVNFDAEFPLKITQRASATFGDRIAMIGGTMGLFLGLSFLGLLDWGRDLWDFGKSLLPSYSNRGGKIAQT